MGVLELNHQGRRLRQDFLCPSYVIERTYVEHSYERDLQGKRHCAWTLHCFNSVQRYAFDIQLAKWDSRRCRLSSQTW